MFLSHLTHKIFNITRHEWLRVIFSFTVKTIIQIIFIITSTILTATFLETYHIWSLPLLYVINSLSIIIWTLIFSFFLWEWEKNRYLVWISIIAIFILSWIWLNNQINLIFFVCLIAFVSIFVNQINILAWLYIEELFSPLEAERTLPVIEGAEPIWGIIWWAILAIAAEQVSINFFFILVFLLLSVLIILLTWTILLNWIPRLINSKEKEIHHMSKLKKIESGFLNIKWIKYLKMMATVVFIQFALYMLVEFQYTSALDASVSSHSNSHSYTTMLAHGLWLWHVIISAAMLLSQIFIVWRLTKKFGIIVTMLIHPLIMIAPSFWMLSKFSLASAVSTKGLFEILSWAHRSAYSSSFYVLKEQIRDLIKEFFEWIARPLWMLFWTLALMILSTLIEWDSLHIGISAIIIIGFCLMALLLERLKSKYTNIAIKNLWSETWLETKLTSIEILTQKWHDWAEFKLWKILWDTNLPELKGKILSSLWRIKSFNSIPDILKCLEDSNEQVQYNAVKALTCFNQIWKNTVIQGFTKHRIINALEKIIISTEIREIKRLAIRVFSNIDHPNIIPFFLSVLNSSTWNVQSDLIYLCRYFDDINCAYYIEKYLDSNDVWVKASTIITLWKFQNYKLRLTSIIAEMIKSDNVEEQKAGIYVLWEIKAKQEQKKLLKLMQSSNPVIKKEAAIALIKIWNTKAVEEIISLMLDNSKDNSEEIKLKLANIDPLISNILRNLLKNEISKYINDIITKNQSNILDELPTSDLESLLNYYTIIDEEKQVILIRDLINRRKKEGEIIQ